MPYSGYILWLHFWFEIQLIFSLSHRNTSVPESLVYMPWKQNIPFERETCPLHVSRSEIFSEDTEGVKAK